MHLSTATMILSCKTNDQLSALHDYFELKISKAKRTGQRVTVYYKCTDPIKSLSLPAVLLKPGGRIR